MTQIQQHTMSRTDAERLTERIRYTAMSVREGVQKLQQLVSTAQDGQAHLALGYASWTAYIADVMGEEPLQLRGREERREVVSWLAGQGMSTRAIAPVVGASKDTVHRDLAARVSDETPAEGSHLRESSPGPTFDPTPDWDPVNTETGEVRPRSGENPPHSITGMDGKTYTRPEPKEASKPQRRPLPDQFRDASVDLRKITERLERLVADDRFPRNREQVALIHQSDLSRASTALAKVIDALNN